MSYIADLHIHSRFSMACSKFLSVSTLSHWAKLKGINLLGTGDAFHPLWLNELKSELTYVRDGVYAYKGVSFLVTNEVSCIFSEGGKGRRIHILVFLPNLESAEKIAEVLTKRGVNLVADGRPILGMSVKHFCELVYKIEKEAIIIPAHVWTPWFGLYGSKSGFNTLKECFGEFSDSILAVETGLSSEPLMNWRIKELDTRSIISFSDAHSLPRLGREATVFSGAIGYSNLKQELQSQEFLETIEFYPEEGKYHYTGHRVCQISLSPKQLREFATKRGDGRWLCPVCHKPLTVGVLERVEELAGRSESILDIEKEGNYIRSRHFSTRPSFRMLIQLEEIIAMCLKVWVKSQKTQKIYMQLVTSLAPEMELLIKTPIDQISRIAGEEIARGIQSVRNGDVTVIPGFDNTYGKVQINS